MNRTSIVLALLLVASLAFSIGQATSRPADAGHAQAAKVQKVKDTAARAELRYIFRALINGLGPQGVLHARLVELEEQTRAVCKNVREIAGPDLTNQRPCPSP